MECTAHKTLHTFSFLCTTERGALCMLLHIYVSHTTVKERECVSCTAFSPCETLIIPLPVYVYTMLCICRIPRNRLQKECLQFFWWAGGQATKINWQKLVNCQVDAFVLREKNGHDDKPNIVVGYDTLIYPLKGESLYSNMHPFFHKTLRMLRPRSSLSFLFCSALSYTWYIRVLGEQYIPSHTLIPSSQTLIRVSFATLHIQETSIEWKREL